MTVFERGTNLEYGRTSSMTHVQNAQTSFFRRHRLLLLLLTTAFLVRVWGIWNADSTDEYNEIFEALRVCSGHLNLERWFKRFYLYLLSVEYGIFYAVGWLLQHFSSPADFASKIVRDMTPLFFLGRATSAVMGTVSVIMTYQIGARLFGKHAGLVAATLLCFNSVNIELSHYARVDATLCAVVLIAFYYIVRIYQGANQTPRKYYALAGLFMGVAFQNKIPSVILIFPFVFSYVAARDFKLSRSILLDKKLFLVAASFMGGLIIGNPAVALAPLKFVKGVLATGDAFTTPINETRSEYIGYVAYLLYFYKELGVPLSLLAAFGLWKGITSRDRDDILLLSFIIPFYGLMGASRYMVSNSYMIPLIPFLFILCAKYLFYILSRLSSEFPPPPRLLALSLAVMLAIPVANAGKMVLSFSNENTRQVAKRWIESNLPFGSRILMDSGKTINSTAPLIAQNRESLMRSISGIEELIDKGTLNDPTKMVDRNAVKYYEMLLKTVPPESYDIVSTKFGLDVRSIEYYRNNGYHFFVISDSMKRSRTDDFFSRRNPEIARFYASLDTDSGVRLIQVIAPTAMSSGDTFYIYQVM